MSSSPPSSSATPSNDNFRPHYSSMPSSGSLSDFTAQVKRSSPLNPSSPASSPKLFKASVPLPAESGATPPASSSQLRPRADSISTLRNRSPGASATNLASVQSDDSPKGGYSDLSPGRVAKPPLEKNPSNWWNSAEFTSRPWRDPKRKKTVPSEQTEGWINTKIRVSQACVAVLGVAGPVAHELLSTGGDLLHFAPIPGLAEAAKVLLAIWDSLQAVDMNRLACLRLTERCAQILYSVRQEVHDAGDEVTEELRSPIDKLIDSFTQVHIFLQKQVHRPFIMRYLKRDEILQQITDCDRQLGESLGMFSLSIQVRILKVVQQAERKRQEDTDALLRALMQDRRVGSGTQPSASLLLSESSQTVKPLKLDLPLSSSTDALHLEQTRTPTEIRALLRELHERQNEVDTAHDTVDLRQLLRTALQTSNDADMIEVLQVGRDEMPEAIKTLQRALEVAVERQDSISEESLKSGKVTRTRTRPTRRLSATPVLISPTSSQSGTYAPTIPPLMEEGDSSESLERTLLSFDESESQSLGEGGSGKDTLDREFIESGIDALRRMSKGADVSLPSWTITKFEVEREQKIGVGYFSDVYKGTWRSRTVAIKVLAPVTPRKLFIREVGIWKKLAHPNVCPLFGASSATADPPWFFVSAYMRNGSLVQYLKRAQKKGRVGSTGGDPPAPLRSMSLSGNIGALAGGSGSGNGAGKRSSKKAYASVDESGDVNLLKMMSEVAKGMEYLHGQGVLHGDLKAANVLVDDRVRCLIADFGQSEMKSEVCRVSGTPPPGGTLRWQAPELMAGLSKLTTEMDVYAFAICCVEILTMGALPWPLMDDDAVRYFVLKENQRPPLPHIQLNSPELREILRKCWHLDPFHRPPFSQVVRELKQLRMRSDAGIGGDTPLSPPPPPLFPEVDQIHRSSPDMQPIPLPDMPDGASEPGTSQGSTVTSADYSFITAESENETTMHGSFTPAQYREGHIQRAQPVMYTPAANSSRASSLFTASTPSSPSDESEVVDMEVADYAGYDSPPPPNERAAEFRNERRYRLLLEHEFHQSLTLPLWTPLPISLGAVGYLAKPSGTFVTLFNAFDPQKSKERIIKGMPNLQGYGTVKTGSQRQDKRNAAQRGMDVISGFLSFKTKGDTFSRPVSRRYSFNLRKDHKAAYLCSESTVYRYMEKLEAPKKWFKAHIDDILETYGSEHLIQKEDVYLIIGTLDSPDYGLFVSHKHPDGQAHFNVFSGSRGGQTWGTFTTDTASGSEAGGPVYEEVEEDRVSASKVSIVGRGWDTVLVAKLRFKPDVPEPTSL